MDRIKFPEFYLIAIGCTATVVLSVINITGKDSDIIPTVGFHELLKIFTNDVRARSYDPSFVENWDWITITL